MGDAKGGEGDDHELRMAMMDDEEDTRVCRVWSSTQGPD